MRELSSDGVAIELRIYPSMLIKKNKISEGRCFDRGIFAIFRAISFACCLVMLRFIPQAEVIESHKYFTFARTLSQE